MQPLWSPDGHRIAFTGAVEEGDAQTRLWLAYAATGQVRDLASDSLEVAYPDSLHWSAEGGELVLVRDHRGRHAVVAVAVDDGAIQPLAGVTVSWAPSPACPTGSSTPWTTPAWPTSCGPAGRAKPTNAASKAGCCIRPAPRARCRCWPTCMAVRWGELDLPQHLAAIDQLQTQGLCDERVAVSGKSYGGYLCCWATGHTQRFQAGVVMTPVGNIETHYGTSYGGYYADPLYVASAPRFDRETAGRLSPIQHVERSKTPKLFLQGKEAERCPKCQPEKLFVSLLRAGGGSAGPAGQAATGDGCS